jgi:hypothetical protein
LLLNWQNGGSDFFSVFIAWRPTSRGKQRFSISDALLRTVNVRFTASSFPPSLNNLFVMFCNESGSEREMTPPLPREMPVKYRDDKHEVDWP